MRKLIRKIKGNARVLAISDNEEDIYKLGDEIDLVHVEVTSDNYQYIDIDRMFDYENIGIEIVDLDRDERIDFLDPIFLRIYQDGNWVFYMDEAHLFSDRFKRQPQYLSRLILGGRKQAITSIIVSQQPADLDPTILKQAHYLIVFKLTYDRELMKIKDIIDPKIVLSLPLYKAVMIRLNSGRFAYSIVDANDFD